MPVLAALVGLGFVASAGGEERALVARGAETGDRDLTPELMYRLLVADIALQRGQPALAARAYFEAAREARNPVFARRAAEIALASRQRSIALEAARLWTELDPDAERPKQIASTLASGTGDEGTAAASEQAPFQSQLQRVLAEAAAKGNVGEAFLELNTLLGTQSDRMGIFKLMQTLAAPYETLPEAQFAVALAAYNTGLKDVGTTATAMKAIERALVLKPAWDRAAILKAEILSRQSPETATSWLASYVAANPQSREAAGALAQLYVQTRQYSQARTLFDRLVTEDPANRDLKVARAVLAVQMKDWPAADKQFQALKAEGPDEDGAIAFALAEVAEESGQLELAIERYKAVPEGERNWLAQLRIATVLGKMKRVDAARRFLADLPAVTIEQRVQVRQSEAQVLRESGDAAGAYAVLEKALAEQPDETDLLYDLAMVAEKLDRIDVAEARLRRVIELKPDNAQALNALGYTLVDRTNRYAEGARYIEQALTLSPDDAFILDSMGWAQYRLGKLDDAERYLRRAIAGRPDAEIAAHLGEVLWVKGERERAQEIWQSQLKTAPDNPVLLETVRRLAR